ncbi:MAG: Tim44/TimA family putative adaptor protein [Candidatus Pacebacteria bacterium]|nr:Tim44/TimA family putative adaptor protein [Candidatus Paceibacterota bacterium]
MSFTTITTIIAALVAVLVLFKLYSVLGKRTGNERPRSMGAGKSFMKAQSMPMITPMPSARPIMMTDVSDDYPKSLTAQIRQLTELDSNFNERDFLNGARNAFKTIVEAFNRGDISAIESWISPDIKQSLSQSLPRSSSKVRIVEAESGLKQIDEIEIMQIQIKAERVLITVLIRSHQAFGQTQKASSKTTKTTKTTKSVKLVSPDSNDLKDSATAASKKAMSAQTGDMGEERQDIWTFAREVTSADPNWQLVSTRSPE